MGLHAAAATRVPHVTMEAMTTRWDAVIFDYGRVLSHSPSPAEMQEFASFVGLTEPPFFQIYSETRDEYDRGRHDCRQHWQRFAEVAGVEITPEKMDRILEFENRMWLRVNTQVVDLARQIRSRGVRTAILSNIPHDLLADARANFDWLPEFDVQIWSCEHGIIKPDPAIYRLCLETLGCQANRALFFDDRPNNVEAARKAGMEAHIFESVEQAKEIVSAGIDLSTRNNS